MCGARWLSLSLLIFFSSLAGHGSYAQVTISEANYQRLVLSLREAKSLSIELETLRLERESLLAERLQLLNEKELSLSEKEALLGENQTLLDEKAKLIADLGLSLTIACESLNQADLQAAKIEAENKVLKIGGAAGWGAAIVFGILYLISR